MPKVFIDNVNNRGAMTAFSAFREPGFYAVEYDNAAAEAVLDFAEKTRVFFAWARDASAALRAGQVPPPPPEFIVALYVQDRAEGKRGRRGPSAE